MQQMVHWAVAVAVLLGTALTFAWAQGPEGGGDAMAKIKIMIERLNNDTSAAVRIAVAEQLSNLMQVEARSNIGALDASVIDAIAALLADSDDIIRYGYAKDQIKKEVDDWVDHL